MIGNHSAILKLCETCVKILDWTQRGSKREQEGEREREQCTSNCLTVYNEMKIFETKLI